MRWRGRRSELDLSTLHHVFQFGSFENETNGGALAPEELAQGVGNLSYVALRYESTTHGSERLLRSS